LPGLCSCCCNELDEEFLSVMRDRLGNNSSGFDAPLPEAEGAESAVSDDCHLLTRFADIGLAAILCGHDGQVQVMNKKATEMLDFSTAADRSLWHIVAEKDKADELKTVWNSWCSRKEGWSYECQVRGAKGTKLDVQLLISPVLRLGAQSWIVILQDFTGAKLHTRQLEIYAYELSQLYQKNLNYITVLEEAQKSSEYFYSLVSHELKTPLTSLKAGLEMLGSIEVLSEQEDALRLISNMKRSTSRLERIINDLLDLAMAKQGSLSLNVGLVDMVAVIQAVVDDMAVLMKRKNLSLRWPLAGKSELIVEGDELRLHQIVQNIISNAIKAAPINGKIRITASRNHNYVRVVVANPGVKLDPALKRSLFQPFTKSSFGGYKAGAGLGLSLVDTLVKAHKGTLEVVEGQRQVAFAFSIPIKRRNAHEDTGGRG
jgi:signal transduction histidine kinase